ncbi:hypothetical protein Misp04_40030 [Micromonospora sp. NBRC 101691]|nr:hypothetical protein Misp04_40030 [Micromonospora sp. NBRC 101691]
MPAKKAKGRKRTTKAATPPAGANAARPRPAVTSAKAKADAGRAAHQIRRTGMSTNLKVTLAIVVAAVVALVGVMVVNRDDDLTPQAASEMLVRGDSHRLSSAADGKTTVVEFLDFECESCLAAYPAVEKLRAEYGDRITYVVRYFPIPSHPNAYNAAHAAEAAARQGKFEEMYKKLFDTATVWGHQQQSQVAVFEGYAQEMGLDLARFKADAASAEVAARVKADAADGESLGVRGTPTFFIDGAEFDDRPSYESLKAAIDRSLAS